jgi:hypothetical protein
MEANTPQAAVIPESAEEAPQRTGPVAAVMLAAGIGGLTLAVVTCWAVASDGFRQSLAYSARVGPLSGKTIWAVIFFLGSWAILAVVLRNRDVDLKKVSVAMGVLIALALIGTFEPFFILFA